MKIYPLAIAFVLIIEGCGTTTEPKQMFSYSGEKCPEILKLDNWEFTIQKPRYGDAIIASLMGQKDAYLYITGGAQSRKKLYDFNGNPFSQTSDENGGVLQVINDSTGCPIGRREFEARKVYFEKREDAIGYKYRIPN
jgi:hypothetical protein